MRGGSVEKRKGNVDSKARPNLWFVLKCHQERCCSRKVVSISFNRGGSKAHPFKRKVYVRFDRADFIEPLLASLKYVYHVHVHIGWSVWRTAGRHVGILSARFKDPACAQVHSGRAFQTARTFHPVFLCLYVRPELLARFVSTLRMRSLSRHPKPPAASQASHWRLARLGRMHVHHLKVGVQEQIVKIF